MKKDIVIKKYILLYINNNYNNYKINNSVFLIYSIL